MSPGESSMTASTLSELSQSSANAMLTAKASKALGGVAVGTKLEDRQVEILRRAAKLLSNIVEGSILIERREVGGLTGSAKGLDGYNRAISALHALKLVRKDAAFTDIFLAYRDCILRVAAAEPVEPKDVTELKTFLGRLSEYFFSDLHRPAPNRRETSPTK